MLETPSSTLTSLTYTFTSFLTVCVHTILFNRAIYPHESFLRTRAYNFPVAQSRHPKVCQWISDAVAAVEAQMLRGNDLTGEAGGWVEKIILVIFSDKSEVMERYVFDVAKFPRIPAQETDTELVREQEAKAGAGTTAAQAKPNSVLLPKADVDLAEQFRAALASISNINPTLDPLPKNCTFSIAVELSDQADPPIGHPQPWIPVQPTLQRHSGVKSPPTVESEETTRKSKITGASLHGVDLGGMKTTPVRKIDAGDMIFEMWVEEGQQKLNRRDENTGSVPSTSN